MKRLISCYSSDFEELNRLEFKQSIQASEGRTVVAETVCTASPLLEGVSNAEVMASFGADIILLNEFDVFTQYINGLEDGIENKIAYIKKLTGRPVGINLEPLDTEAHMLDAKVELSEGRIASVNSYQRARELGVDILILTGNPSTGVTNQSILKAIPLASEHFGGLILAGKMHGAGVNEKIVDTEELVAYIEAGADGVLIPTIGTVPSVTESMAYEASQAVKQKGGLVMSTIGTSQESAESDTVREFGIVNKRVGSDMHHIGDGGFGRMPIPENIMTLSIAVRGKRHTYFRMAQSIHR